MFKSGHRPYYDEIRRMRASGTNAALLGDLMSDAMFRIGSLRMAEWRADQGQPAYVYQFDWQSPAGFESCHCLEIPFVFNNLAHWTDSPMLKGAKPEETKGLAEAMHGAWIAFARTGKPDHPGLPPWPPYRREDRMTMRFDSTIGPVSDLAGLEWRQTVDRAELSTCIPSPCARKSSIACCKRRGRYHLFDRLDPARTALVVIDMQTAFCAPGAPAEVPASRGIVEPINGLTAELRSLGVPVIWVLHANSRIGGKSDWELFFNTIVADDVREQTLESLTAAKQSVWAALVTAPADQHGAEEPLQRLDPGLVRRSSGCCAAWASTPFWSRAPKTNVCCESTARDAMMLDFKVVLVEDCCAALSDDEHRSALENVIQQFGDVMTADEVLMRLRRLENDRAG